MTSWNRNSYGRWPKNKKFHSDSKVERLELYNIVDIGDMKDRHRVETLQSISICMAVQATLSLLANTLLAFESKCRRNS